MEMNNVNENDENDVVMIEDMVVTRRRNTSSDEEGTMAITRGRLMRMQVVQRERKKMSMFLALHCVQLT